MDMEPLLIHKGKRLTNKLHQKPKRTHKAENFYDEYKRLLIENGIELDEKYLL
jgi:hypothetical protein